MAGWVWLPGWTATIVVERQASKVSQMETLKNAIVKACRAVGQGDRKWGKMEIITRQHNIALPIGDILSAGGSVLDRRPWSAGGTQAYLDLHLDFCRAKHSWNYVSATEQCSRYTLQLQIVGSAFASPSMGLAIACLMLAVRLAGRHVFSGPR